MRAFFAITKQTIRASLRSKVFHVLLLINLAAVILLPLTVSSDGTAAGQFQVSLTYSLNAVRALLSLAAVWLGCTALSREIESYNLHLVLTKPTRVWQLWLGKWAGVFAMTGFLYILSAAVVYALLFVSFNSGQYSTEELREARNEVLVGRRTFQAARPDFVAFAKREYRRRETAGELAPGHSREEVLKELIRQIRARSTEVEAGFARTWKYENVRVPDPDARVFVRYKIFVASTSESKQRMTRGTWALLNPDAPEDQRLAILPQRVMGGSFHEFSFPASMIPEGGTLYLQYVNQDAGKESVILQAKDWPVLLARVTGFANNYIRGVLLVLLQLALLGILGCTCGAALSTPVALFAALSYLVLGGAAAALVGQGTVGAQEAFSIERLLDVTTRGVARAVDAIVLSLGRFDPTHDLARGYLIEIMALGQLILFEGLLRAGPLVVLGIYVLGRRELGKVIRR
ncbi:MAG: ABC transporter permease [Candidatus Pacebacteria bacterium]|nr:ABC transporter permease [Candidatus Paceibacterota bacterium]